MPPLQRRGALFDQLAGGERPEDTQGDRDVYTVVAIAKASYMARGGLRDGSGRSFAAKVMTPNPRRAKKVSETLAPMIAPVT